MGSCLSLLSVTIKPVFIVQNERGDVALLIQFLLKIFSMPLKVMYTNPLMTSACDLFTKVIAVFLLCIHVMYIYTSTKNWFI